MSFLSRVRSVSSVDVYWLNSEIEIPSMCSSIFLPVRGSIISFASSNEDDPVAMIFRSGYWSMSSLRVNPMFLTRWASSMMMRVGVHG